MKVQNFLKKIPSLNIKYKNNQNNKEIFSYDIPNVTTNQINKNKNYFDQNFQRQETNYDQQSTSPSILESRLQKNCLSISPINIFGQQPNLQKSKIDKQLNQIEKLKKQYEMKIQNRGRLKSIEKNTCRSNSNQKHLLKPSNNPTINKDLCNSFEQKQKNNLAQIQRRESEDRLRNYYQQAKRYSQRKQVKSGQKNRQQDMTNLALIQELKCKNEQIQYKNKKLSQIQNQNEQYKQKLKEVIRQNLRLRQNHEKVLEEKQNLETILKQILYQREKLKLINQKQTNGKNTPKQNKSYRSIRSKNKDEKRSQIIGSSQNQDSYNINNSTKKKKSNEKINLNTSIDQSQNKIKVQSILQKLKIKISRY